ncbi:ABC transporter ATP-binding protein [Paenibacillus sp. MWE-103]|uniref:ABC transporter ATP-binding protein n=1 Tax=Paenibacillus artemisiicola TaxID=1172618 RepID=A0ABS3WHU6_9BACL|nr:ABC transporter ATP-binding protein [Paenibacillus artemisiicola]MBO7747867.1 ABC transporter ATP-binding protein [Paenibacillus artemisiicola]
MEANATEAGAGFQAEAIVEAASVAKSFGAVRALDGVGFTLREGRCSALLGPNGAGKTTLLRILTGLLRPTSGEVRFRGLPPGGDPRALIGYLPQLPAFYGWMSGKEFLQYAGELCGLSAREASLRGDGLLARVGLGAAAGKRRIAGYSGGMKQRLGLAQALVHRPRLLVLDEPVSALDPIGRREVMELLRELKRETTVLFSTHVLPDAEELCDDVLILQRGRIVVGGAMEAVRSRYRAPVVTLEVEPGEPARERLAAWQAELAHPAIASASLQPEGGVVRFEVRDADEARAYLLGKLAESRLPFARLEIGHTSLEDIFREAVQGP